MKSSCDLHLHSRYSDGRLSPEALVARARDASLSAVSITDHDSLNGQEEAFRAGRAFGIEVLSGIEFSSTVGKHQVHILGYLFDTDEPRLGEQVRRLADARRVRARSIVEKLRASGIRISFDEVCAEAGRGTLGRPHIAMILLRNGLVTTVQEAFDRYLGVGRPAYVPKTVLPLEEIVGLITDGGGVAVWAHPGALIRRPAILDKLVEAGVRGVEVWHPNHTDQLVRDIGRAARARGMVATGGSDYHFDEIMKADVGGVSAPYESVAALRKAAVAVRGA